MAHMLRLTRRGVLKGFGAASLAAAHAGISAPLFAQAKSRLVVIGGGPGGASVAGLVKRAAADIDVVLVEPQAAYTTCFYSNHYLAGLRTIESLTHSYEGLGRLGIRIAQDRAEAIDRTARTVRLTDGRLLPYDVLVVAPASISNSAASKATTRPPPVSCLMGGGAASSSRSCTARSAPCPTAA